MQDVQGPRPGSPGDAEDWRELGLHRGEVDFGGSGKKRGKVGAGPRPQVMSALTWNPWAPISFSGS